MDSDHLQFLRSRLEKRLQRLKAANELVFHASLVCTWKFLQGNEITKGILDELEHRGCKLERIADKVLIDESFFGRDELDHAAISYWVIKKRVAIPPKLASHIGQAFTLGTTKEDWLEAFRSNLLMPLFDYIEEHIDDGRVTLATLLKYKHRCEWFRRTDLLSRCMADTRKGENILVYDLYEYLHDQGVPFHIEPKSASGRIDLISDQSGKDRLVADAKIFNPDGGQGVRYIAKGFRQIYEYTKDYNEPFGYLVIYKTCERDLSIATPHQEFAVPFLTHNNKMIFLLVIDICHYPESASNRGKLKAYEITPEQLIEAVQTAAITQ